MKQPVSVSPLRIEVNYAAVQATYWSSNCTLRGFMAIFLAYRGFSDAQVGYTTSIIYLCAIGLQLLLSSYSDRHEKAGLKRVVSCLYVVALSGCAALYILPLPVALMMLVYSLTCAFDVSIDSLLNALMMQYCNRGIPVRYGWPRGIGSIAYAGIAYGLGLLMERYSPNVILPVFLVLASLGLALLLLLPSPGGGAAADVSAGVSPPSASYRQMLRGNPTFVLLLCACVLSAMGQCAIGTYLIRVIQSLGGGTAEYGLAMLLQSGVELPVMFASSHLLRRFGSKRLLACSFFCVFVKGLALTLISSLTALYIVMLSSVLCFGLYGFSAVLFVNSITQPGEKVRAQSLISLCYTGGLGGIIGNLLSGFLIGRIGLHALLNVSWVLCLLGAVVMALCCRCHTRQFSGCAQ